ncbi:MAG: hypothetical protein BWY72_01804 [Bacteroidetes bacterium ADurb.Bin416]|nr:MAG: hypothetical protein BWY72_01804 [Bacteroidetes bacterium ADurb.Bin416]
MPSIRLYNAGSVLKFTTKVAIDKGRLLAEPRTDTL